MDKRLSFIAKIGLISFVLPTLACAFSSPGFQPTVTLFVLPTQIPTAVPVATPENEPVLLDPCSLATADEVGAILGGPVDIQSRPELAGCIYSLPNTDPAAMKSLGVSVAQGEKAKESIVHQLGMAMSFAARDQVDAAGFEDLLEQAHELTLREVSEQIYAIYQKSGGETTSYADLGDAAYWTHSSTGGSLVVIRSDVYVWIRWAGSDLNIIPDQLAPLARSMLERLPAAFYVSPKTSETINIENSETAFLDMCSLITPEEARVILGEPVDVSHEQFGRCLYSGEFRSSGTSMLSILALRGEEAKSSMLLSLGMYTQFLGRANTLNALNEVGDRLPEMTLQEVMVQSSENLQEAGVAMTAYPDLGDVAYWLPVTDFSTNGNLFVVSNDVYVDISLSEETDRALSAPTGQLAPLDRAALIAQTILERLPPTFYANSGVGMAWVTSPSTGQVFVIDVLRGRVASVIDVGGTPVDVAADRRGAWVAGGAEGVVKWIDLFSLKVVNSFPVGGTVSKVAVASDESIWAVGDFGIKRIAPSTSTQQDVAGGNSDDMQLGDSVIWVTQPQDQQVLKIDLATYSVIDTVQIEGKPTDIAMGLGSLWVLLGDRGKIVQIDPQADTVLSSIPIGETATALGVDSYHVWYVGKTGLRYVDSGNVIKTTEISMPLSSIMVQPDVIWVTIPDEGAVMKMSLDASGAMEFSTVIKIMTGGDPSALALFR